MSDHELRSLVEGSSGIDFRAWYTKNGLAWGAGDLFVYGGGKPSIRTAEVIAILASSFHKNDNPVFSEIVVVQPPVGTPADERMNSLMHDLDAAVKRSRGRALAPEEIAVLSNRIKIVVPQDFQNGSVLSIIAAAKTHSAVIVEEAARYRGLVRMPPGPAPTLRMPEDIWVPHLHELSEGAITAAKTSTSYVVLDANEDWPLREDNRELLLSIDGISVLAGDFPEGSQSILAQHIEKWSEEIRTGVIGPIFSEIEKLPQSLDNIKPLIKLQVMHKAGLHPMVEQVLRSEPELIRDLAPLPALQVAEIAADAGAFDVASGLIGNIAFDQLPMEAIENALALANRVSDPASVQSCKKLLEERFPASLGLLRHRANELLEAGNFEVLARLLSTSPDDDDKRMSGFYDSIAEGLASPPSAYNGLARSIIDAYPDQAGRTRLFIAREAVRAERYADALQVATGVTDADITRGMTATVLSALEAALLTRGEGGENGLDRELAQAGVLLTLRYLARHPADGQMRVRLVDALSAESMGHLGLALLIDAAVKLASIPLTLRDIRTLDTWTTAPSPNDTAAFLKVALPWLQTASPVFVGRMDIPRELLTSDADKLATGISRLLEHYEPLNTPEDLATVRSILALGMAVARHGTIADADLNLVRILAVRLALASQFQAARDFAEHALQVSDDSRTRARMAWLCYGDVYQRTGNTIDGLVGALCCLVADDSATPEQVFYESVLFYRLMRDLRMIDVGLAFLDGARKALERFGALDRYVHRIETLQLQARLLQARGNALGLPQFVESLLTDLARNAHAVLAQSDEPAPAAVNMAETLRMADAAGVKPSQEVVEAFELLVKESHAPLRAIIAASRLAHPAALQVLQAVQQMELAREPIDVAYDLRQISVLAERLLGSPEALANPSILTFAVEVLTDHGVPLPGAANARQEWIPPTIEASGKLAAELSASMAIPIVLMGMDADGRLIRCVAQDGDLKPPVREAQPMFSEDRLREWSREFPFRYGIDEETPNLFYTSTEGLGVTDLPERAVLVTSANIQHWSPNLIRTGEAFAGQTRRLAAVPSLAWLRAARQHRATDRRALAWIPKQSTEEGAATLQSVIDRVAEPLAAHGVDLDTSSAVPRDLAGAELAIVTAHGGLVPGNRYFQAVRDDAALRMTGAELSSALRNVGVAVLFVCSGGRLDPHPMAITTLGLARQALGNGCATVIASPWPIDSRIPSYWLPTFLEAWDAGIPVIDAAFQANLRVRDAFSSELRDCLAMSVYGDPLRTKARP